VNERLLENLNAAQREAVVWDNGPLVVLAGPGTGKTRVLVHRVAWAVAERGLKPDRILAVTFTVKAAGELRQRLADLLGTDAGEAVRVHTFNGLGWQILRRFAGRIGFAREPSLIDAVQELRLIREIILDHGLFVGMRGRGVEWVGRACLRAFTRLAHMGLLPEDCTAHAAAWRRRLNERAPASNDAERAEEIRLRTFEDEAKAYERYLAECIQRGWITFDNQVLLPIRLLRKTPDIAAVVRSELDAVLVDEFQDVNPAQIELLRLLMGPEHRRNPDIAVVGDDDQAIYAFRGADERAFDRFRRHWPGAREIELTENYRSGPAIVAAANATISRAGMRFHPDKRLESSGPAREIAAQVEAVGLEKGDHEGSLIAAMILLDRARSNGNREWDSYAVITRSNGQAAAVADALVMEGIPVALSTDEGALDHPVVDDALAWGAWLGDAQAVGDAMRAMLRPPVAMSPMDVHALHAEWRGIRTRAGADMQGVPDPGLWHVWLQRAHGREPGVARLCSLRRDLERETAGMRADEALQHLILRLDFVHADLAPAHERAARAAALAELLRVARQKQPCLDPPGNLGVMVEYLRLLKELGDLGTPRGPGDVDADAGGRLEDHAGAVQVMTAHKAKGLEFDTVFVAHIGPYPGSFGGARARDDWEAPDGLFDEIEDRPEVARLRDEERRLFYVACTRAKRRLVLLARWNRNPSTSMHLFEELARPVPAGVPVNVLLSKDVREAAADAGLGSVGRLTPLEDGARREPVEQAAERARAAARLAGALALEALEQANVGEREVAAAQDVLREVCERVAAIAHVRRTGELPSWYARVHPDVRTLAERTANRAASESVSGLLLRPFRPPLRLSYSAVSQFLRCPRCYALREQFDLREPVREEVDLGLIVHEALQEYLEAVREAQSDGREPPGREFLQQAGREAYLRRLGPGGSVDRAMLAQLEDQLNLYLARFHPRTEQVLELERSFRMPYEVDGEQHELIAKIDRIELLSDGTYRVVDYKSGGAWKSLLEPERDDLQLGIYAMVVRHHFGSEVQGVLEYWLTATGECGRLDFADVDEAKVRCRIDEAARGMLEGRFERGKQCSGDCGLLGV
jgi:DNA helicase-2/ATP-dependent DNA helicase PcrA